MKHLEKAVHEHFARMQNASAATSTNGTTVPSAAPASITDNSIADAGMLGTPFAKVNTVEPGSPADQAGLKMGDMIRGFGSVHWLNHERLSKVAEAVQQNEGVGRLQALVPQREVKLTVGLAPSVGQGVAKERDGFGYYRA